MKLNTKKILNMSTARRYRYSFLYWVLIDVTQVPFQWVWSRLRNSGLPRK